MFIDDCSKWKIDKKLRDEKVPEQNLKFQIENRRGEIKRVSFVHNYSKNCVYKVIHFLSLRTILRWFY